MPSIKFDTIVETSKVVSGFKDIQNAVHQTASKVQEEGKSIDDVISKIQSGLNVAIGGWTIGKFVSQIMQVRGQFQQTEMAFKTMLQSEKKANDLMQQMIHTAAITPFGVEDVTEGAKQLLAFNVAAEDVNDTLIRLGDVAAGMGLNLSDLVMLYGTTIAKGKMDTMDLYQFLNRGIPIADELAKVMGLDVNNAIAEVKEQLTAGKVTSDIFIKAMQNMTAEGSKFGGLMEAQSRTITGQISNIEDAIEQMFNELGRSQEGIINTGLDVVSSLVENWQKVGEVVMVAATAYGTYKAILMTVTALQTLNNRILQQAVLEKTLAAAAGINLSNAEAVAAARTKFLTLAQQGLTAALRETAAATLANPYVLMAAAITGLVYTIYKFSTSASAAEIAQNAWNKSIDEFNKKADERKQKIKDLVNTIQDASSTDLQKQLSFDELKYIAPELTNVYDCVEKLESADLSQFNSQLNEMTDHEREQGLKAQIKQLQEYAKALQNVSATAEASSARRAASQGLKDKYGIEVSWSFDKANKLNDAIFEYISKLRGELEKIQKAKDELTVPTKIDVKIAEDDYKQSKEKLDYLSKFALAMKNDIEGKPTHIPFDGGEADRVINELEEKAANLKKEQEKHPIQFTAEKQKALNTYQALLRQIKDWKKTAWKNGVFDIPIQISLLIKRLAKEVDNKKKKADETREKANQQPKGDAEDASTAYRRAKQEYNTAKNELAKIQKAVKNGVKGYTVKQLNDAIETAETKKKAFQKLGGDTSNKSTKKDASDRKKIADDQKKAQEDLNKELEELERKNQDDLIALKQEGTEKKLAEIRNDYKKRLAEIDKQETEFKKKNKEAGKSSVLTKDQSDALNQARDLAKQNREKQETEVNKESLDSMRDYLKEYGSLYQQKQAIAEEYEEKIAKSQTEGEKRSLQQEKKKALSNFDYESISMGIDWKGLLSGVGSMSKEMLQPMLDKLEAYAKTTQFQQADSQTQQKVVDLMQEIRTYLGTDQSATWESLANAITDFHQSVADFQQATEKEKSAQANLSQAKTDLKNGKITKEAFDKIQKSADEASLSVVGAKEKMDALGVALNSTTDAVTNYTSGLSAALNKITTWKGAEGFQGIQSSVSNIDALKGALDESLSTMGEGMAKTIGSGLSKTIGSTLGSFGNGISGVLSRGLGAVIGIVAQIPKMILSLASAIKDFVKGILDSFTELLKFEWLSDLVNSILDAVGNLINAIFDLPENLFKAIESIVVNGIGGLLNTILGRIGNILSFGALSSKGPSAWFTNSNAEKVQKRIAELNDSNESLEKSIDRLNDTVSKEYGRRAIEASEEAKRQTQQKIENKKEIAKQQAGYHDSHHSWSYYWKGFSKEEIAKIEDVIGRDFNGDIWNLDENEMSKMLGHKWFVDKIKGTGSSAYANSVFKAIEAFADSAGEVEEITDKLKESLTQISFDSMKDSFISNLMDMTKSAQDFSDDFAEMMQKALLSYSMEDLINGDLKKLYDDWAKMIEDKNGALTDADIDAFNKRYDDIIAEGLKRRDDWAKVTGYTGSSSQTATSGGWASMGQETADELNGRFTALQIAGESIAHNMEVNISQMETIVTLGISTNGAVLEIRNMMVMTNSYLEDIVKYAKLTYNDFGSKMDDMYNRLKNI